MTEIPEHLLKRSAGARARRSACRAAAKTAAADAPAAERAAPTRRGRGRRARRRRRRAGEGASPRARRRSPRTCSSGAQARKAAWPAVAAAPPAAPSAAAAAADRAASPRRPRTGPGGHTQRLLTVVKSRLDPETSSRGARTRCTPGRTCSSSSSSPSLLVHRRSSRSSRSFVQRAAARAGQRQPDAEPVEGAVVLPRPAGAAHDVPPDGRRRDHPGHGPRSC